jgi:hypothetical protein
MAREIRPLRHRQNEHPSFFAMLLLYGREMESERRRMNQGQEEIVVE